MSWLRVFSLVVGQVSRARVAARALPLGVALACGGAGSPDADDDLPAPTPGYPPITSRLTLRLGGEFQKLCHATVIDPRWVLLGSVHGRQLHGHAATSPITEEQTNYFASIGLAYRF